jgi:hypothetical protein
VVVQNRLPKEKMIKWLFVLLDMEFDEVQTCGDIAHDC